MCVSNEIDAHAIAKTLIGRGWSTCIQPESQNASRLVTVSEHGWLKCVDGRGSDATACNQRGPKMLGGVYGIAANRDIQSTVELEEICREVRSAGFVPTTHGDESGVLGCGYCRLWFRDEFADEPLIGSCSAEFSPEDGAEVVAQTDGVVENTVGNHAEKVVYLNLVVNKTMVPNPEDQSFVVDVWAADAFDLDVNKYCVTAAATIEKLNPRRHPCPWTAVIVVPDDQAKTT